MKTAGDDGNAATAPDIVEPSGAGQAIPNTNTTGSFGGPGWIPPNQQLPILTPSSGHTYDKNGSPTGALSGFGDNAESQDASGSPDGAPSNRPTPNSSGAGSDQRMHLAPGQMGSGHNSFHASPISPNQTLMNPGPLDGSTQGFFGDTSAFTMPTTLTDQQNGFVLSNDWVDLPNQAGVSGVTPVSESGEGVLRALMNMGPMDAMDLSTWDQGNN